MKHKLKVVGKRISAILLATVFCSIYMISYCSAIDCHNEYYTGSYHCASYTRSYFTVSYDEIGFYVYQSENGVYIRDIATTGAITSNYFTTEIANARKCDINGNFIGRYTTSIVIQGSVSRSSSFLVPDTIYVENRNAGYSGNRDIYTKSWNDHYY